MLRWTFFMGLVTHPAAVICNPQWFAFLSATEHYTQPLPHQNKTQKTDSEGVHLQGDSGLRRHKQTPFSPKAMAFLHSF